VEFRNLARLAGLLIRGLQGSWDTHDFSVQGFVEHSSLFLLDMANTTSFRILLGLACILCVGNFRFINILEVAGFLTYFNNANPCVEISNTQ
jgi:hypothetical protein